MGIALELPNPSDWTSPFSGEHLRRIEELLGRAIPEPLRTLWERHGIAEIATDSAYVMFYDARLVEDLIGQYAEAGLRDMVPVASDGGSRDYAIDVAADAGPDRDAVFLVGRGDLTRAFASRIAPDLATFLSMLRSNARFEESPATNEQRWTEAKRDQSLELLHETFPDLSRNDVEIASLHYRTLAPAKLVLRRDRDIAGVPCRAGFEVLLDVNGRVQSAMLSRNHSFGGIECKSATIIVIGSGKVPHRFTPVADVTLEGIVWAGGTEITMHDPSLAMMWGTPAHATVIGAIPCAPAAIRLRTSPSRSVEEATLSSACRVAGVDLPAGAWFELLGERLFRVQLPAPQRIGATDVPANVRTYLT